MDIFVYRSRNKPSSSRKYFNPSFTINATTTPGAAECSGTTEPCGHAIPLVSVATWTAGSLQNISLILGSGASSTLELDGCIPSENNCSDSTSWELITNCTFIPVLEVGLSELNWTLTLPSHNDTVVWLLRARYGTYRTCAAVTLLHDNTTLTESIGLCDDLPTLTNIFVPPEEEEIVDDSSSILFGYGIMEVSIAAAVIFVVLVLIIVGIVVCVVKVRRRGGDGSWEEDEVFFSGKVTR